MEEVVRHLVEQLGADVVQLPEAFSGRRFGDWSGLPVEMPKALIRPLSTAHISTALAICHRHRQPVVIQGGLTGLTGGASTAKTDVALSLERMRAIEEVDPISATMIVQSGATLQAVQERAIEAGFFFPLDLGARGSCTVGGVLATNAGGNRVIKYGMAREHCVGLEAVLPDGRLIGRLDKMLKNNTGYDLRDLLIGSEGTLAVISRAVLRLRPRPTAVSTAWCGLEEFEKVTTLLRRAQGLLSGRVSAFEVMWSSYYGYIRNMYPRLRKPLAENYNYHVLLETDGSDSQAQQAQFDSFLQAMFEAGIVKDAVIASSQKDVNDFWAVREATGEFLRLLPNMIAFDISFAVRDVETVATEISRKLRARYPDCLALFYGHLGDGNIHLIVDVPGHTSSTAGEVEELVYGTVGKFSGAVSAEHGIGLKKRDVLARSRSNTEIDVMRGIRRALDPYNILNPGRIF
jgi:FAD/FMN-containing dehydrogenase